MPAINGALRSSKKAEVAAMAESIKTAINAFYAEYSVYPTDAQGAVFSNTSMTFLNTLSPSNSATAASGANYRGISFLEVPPKFTNASGIVTPLGFMSGKRQTNFFVAVNLAGTGSLTNRVGRTNYVVPANIAVWVVDPADSNKPVGTFK